MAADSEPKVPGFFPILPWSPLRGWEEPWQDHDHGLESIAAAGFTMAGFVQARDLAACHRLGLRAIVAPPKRPRYMADHWRALVESDMLDAHVRDWVREAEAAPGSEAIDGYFVMDEPGASMFPVLGEVMDAFRRHAPGKLAYVNLYPNYATINTYDESGAAQRSQLQTDTYAEHLERYVAEARPQFLSYDNYMVLYAQDLRDAEKSALYFRNLMEVRRVALASGLPRWQVVCSNQIRAHTVIPTAANLSLQAYTTLAAGGTGVGWFTYYGLPYGHAPIDGATGRKTPTWFALRAVNEQLRVMGGLMAGLRSAGVYVAAPPDDERWRDTGLVRLPGRVVQSVEAPEALMLGELSDPAGADYALLVNLSLERSQKVFPTFPGARTAAAASPDDGRFRPVDVEAGLWLAPGHGILLRVE